MHAAVPRAAARKWGKRTRAHRQSPGGTTGTSAGVVCRRRAPARDRKTVCRPGAALFGLAHLRRPDSARTGVLGRTTDAGGIFSVGGLATRRRTAAEMAGVAAPQGGLRPPVGTPLPARRKAGLCRNRGATAAG